MSFRLIYENHIIKISKNVVLPVVCYACEIRYLVWNKSSGFL